MAEIIKLDNFLAENYYQGIFNVINSNTEPFPWFLLRDVVGLKKHKNDTDFSFIHMFFQNGTYHSKLYDKIVLPVFSKIITDIEKKECTLLRSKLNGYVNHYKQVEHDWHTDLESGEPYKSALFYINTNNGYTQFDDGERGHIKIESVANRICIAPGDIRHRSVTQTDVEMRQTLNIVYR